MIYYMLLLGCILADCASVDPDTLGAMACNISATFGPIVELLIATAYISGVGFGLAAMFKFKQVKDNPTQIPISAPFALLAISAILVFLPDLFAPLGATLFGTSGVYGSPSGTQIAGLTD